MEVNLNSVVFLVRKTFIEIRSQEENFNFISRLNIMFTGTPFEDLCVLLCERTCIVTYPCTQCKVYCDSMLIPN